jgi:transcriptional adapter 2-beta
MHPTGGPAYFDASSSNKSSSDNQAVDPMLLGGHLLSFNETQVGSTASQLHPESLQSKFSPFQLCSTLNLPPTRYLTIKTVLLSNPKLADMEPAEKVILKHLSNSGWVRKTSLD